MQLCYIDESGTPDAPGNTSTPRRRTPADARGLLARVKVKVDLAVAVDAQLGGRRGSRMKASGIMSDVGCSPVQGFPGQRINSADVKADDDLVLHHRRKVVGCRSALRNRWRHPR